jgi:hypothetical protein
MRTLDDPDVEMRWRAAFALGQFGEDAKCAAPAFRRIRESAGRDERKIIDNALAKIDPASFPDPDAKPSQ